jgi:uridine kinase
VETYAELARLIVERPARLGRTRLVAVDGPSGAGKTVFADRLASALAPGVGVVPIVHTDDLLAGWEDQFTFWPRLEEWVLAPLRAGRPGRYRSYDWVREEFGPHWVTVPAAPVVILEGVSSGRAAIAPELTLTAFVTASARLRLDRAVRRDGAELLPYLIRWRQGERRHFRADATADRADLVVDGAPGQPAAAADSGDPAGGAGGAAFDPAGGAGGAAFDPEIHYVRLA